MHESEEELPKSILTDCPDEQEKAVGTSYHIML
jgi:hypothetical protein